MSRKTAQRFWDMHQNKELNRVDRIRFSATRFGVVSIDHIVG
jgi:hypothetical protein